MTVRLFLLFIFSVAVFFSHAQTEEQDLVEQDSLEQNLPEQDSLVQDLLEQPEDSVNQSTINLALIIDYVKLLTIPSSFEKKFEGGIEILLKQRISLLAEMGTASITPSDAISGDYEANGLYYRLGVGYTKNRTAKNKIGIYALYGTSTYDETINYRLESPSGTQPTFSSQITRPNLSATWWELMLYTDQKLNELITIGLNIRYRQQISAERFTPIDSYAIPGYGRVFDNSVPAMNLILKFTF